ncbi:hypothetical protein QTP70_004009 [Hemibagrus guttatus]|uniref:Uncharacterized protein n=1 Tax=Hemibagrus guttatus TaxID=175788 RepID=A0AAE0USI1_9TELE|nr:hypothetical protein QTP70_004009 [Hemibagrus guttatus]
MDDQIMKKKGRGTHQDKITTHDSVNLRDVKWFDNQPVTLSSFVGAKSVAHVQRQEHNKSMGGVDLLDSPIALYHTKIHSKKCYHRLVFHMLDLTVVEAWLLY